MPAAVPKLMGDAAVLMSVQGSEGVGYILLVSLSTMEVSLVGRIVSHMLGLWEWGLNALQSHYGKSHFAESHW